MKKTLQYLLVFCLLVTSFFSTSVKAANNKDINKSLLINNNSINYSRDEAAETQVKKFKVLTLLVEFGDDEYGKGPTHNNIPKPSRDNNIEFWLDDFSLEYYNKMLFSPIGYDYIDQNNKKHHIMSMKNYYYEQSGGNVDIDGKCIGWIKLPHSEAYYGDDDTDYDNKLPGTPKDLVNDAVQMVKDSIPFDEFDIEDPDDIDNDGNYEEPDGTIDHLIIVHAGKDQSSGGGNEKSDAVWAHRGQIDISVKPSESDKTFKINSYTIQGEDEAVGTFCHEFGHDLGLKDEYDTIGSSLHGEPIGNYSLMAGGCRNGSPLATKPASISPYGKIILEKIWGFKWANVNEISLDELNESGNLYRFDQRTTRGVNNQIVKVNLPPKSVQLPAKPKQGAYSWYSTKKTDGDLYLKTKVKLPKAKNASLNFSMWYDIESQFDYVFAQISNDEGKTWTSLSSTNTVNNADSMAYEKITKNLPGYTGKSNGWINEAIDISKYCGQDIWIQFKYMTDAGTTLNGVFLDNIKVLCDNTEILFEGAEDNNANWVTNYWNKTNGIELKEQYYLLEWVNQNKCDEGLKNTLSWIEGDQQGQFFENNEGLLIWYVDKSFTDNYVGNHPGEGFIGIVDSNPYPIVNSRGQVALTTVQLHDAAFSVKHVKEKVFNVFGEEVRVKSEKPVSEFYDVNEYWTPIAPSNSRILPKFGLKIKVIEQSLDGTGGVVKISRQHTEIK